MARDLYDDHFKAVESMPRGVVVTLRNIATQLESAWELHTNRQVRRSCHFASEICSLITINYPRTEFAGFWSFSLTKF